MRKEDFKNQKINLSKPIKNSPWLISPDDIVYDAIDKMSKFDLSALLVIKNNIIQGTFSEREYLRNIILEGKSSKDTCVKEVMNEAIYIVRPNDSVIYAIQLMVKNKLRSLPVLTDNELLGFISLEEVIDKLLDSKDFQISQLINYIVGSDTPYKEIQPPPSVGSIQNSNNHLHKMPTEK